MASGSRRANNRTDDEKTNGRRLCELVRVAAEIVVVEIEYQLVVVDDGVRPEIQSPAGASVGDGRRAPTAEHEVLMFLTGCLSPEEAYRGVEWKTMVLIGALLSLGRRWRRRCR